MTASVTSAAAAGLANTLSKAKPVNNNDDTAKSSASDTKSANASKRIKLNPFLNDFFDCIENLPGKLQILISELRSVDAQVNG